MATGLVFAVVVVVVVVGGFLGLKRRVEKKKKNKNELNRFLSKVLSPRFDNYQ